MTGTEQSTEVKAAGDTVKILPEDVTNILKTYKSESMSTQPKGRPKSGRTWKTEQRQRFSSLKKDKPLRTSWKWKMEEKARLKSLKAYEHELQAKRKEEHQKLWKKRMDRKKRREENARKSEVVQEIKNTAKIKRMKKKQLRQLEKR